MANISNLTDKLSSLAINSDTPSTSSTTTSKLPTKYQGGIGAVRPLPGSVFKPLNTKTSSSTLNSKISSNVGTPTTSTATERPPAERQNTLQAAPTTQSAVPSNVADIGTYDGGFESEMDGGRGKDVDGEAAEELALDSSTSR